MEAKDSKAPLKPSERAALVIKICDSYPNLAITMAKVKSYLTDAGVEVTRHDLPALLTAAKAESQRRYENLAEQLSKVLSQDPPRSEIKREALKLGVVLSGEYTFARLRAILLTYPELWTEQDDMERLNISFDEADMIALNRISAMLGGSKAAAVRTLVRAFVVAIDQGLVDPTDIIDRVRKVRADDVLRASAIFDSMSFK